MSVENSDAFQVQKSLKMDTPKDLQDSHSIVVYSTIKDIETGLPLDEAETCTETQISNDTSQPVQDIQRMTTKELLEKIKLERDSKLANPNAWYEQTQSRFTPTRTLSQRKRLSRNLWVKKHKRYGCCFKTKEGCMYVCPWIIFWIIIVVALTLFFIWPRKLTCEISSPIQEPMNVLSYSHGTKGNQSQILMNANPSVPFSAYATVLFPISIQSFNWIPIIAEELYLEYHMIINGTQYPTLNGTSIYNQAFLKSQSITTIPFVYIFNFML